MSLPPRTRAAALAAPLLAALWASHASASAPPPTSGVPITENAADDVGAHAALGPDGDVHVVWERGGSVYHRVKTASGLGPEELVAAGGAPAVAIGPGGVPFVAFVSAGQALVASRTGGSWQTPDVAIGGGVSNVDLAVAADGALHVVAGGDFDSNGRPDVTYYTAAGGAFTHVATYGGWFEGWPCYCGEYFWTPDVEVDAAGYSYLAFRDGHPGSGSGNWSAVRIVTNNPAWTSADLSGSGFGINGHGFRKGSLAVDAAGVAHLVQAGSGRCYAAAVDGATFAETDLGPGSQPALSVDAAGAVHVALQDTVGAIAYARDDGAGFSGPWTIAAAGAWPAVAGGDVFFETGADLEIHDVLPGGLLGATPGSHDFGPTPAGGASTVEIVLRNGEGARPVLLGALSLSGAQASSFAIASDGCSGKNLAAGAACTVSVRFSPDAAGDFSASLALKSSSPYGPETIPLQGSAISCSYAVSQASALAPSGSSEGSVGVTASDPACPWTAVANDAFLQVTAGASGTGDGIVSWSAASNAGPARSGTLTIAGHTFTVDQGDGCRVGVHAPGTPATSAGADAAGGSVEVAVSASDPACAWSASSEASWISVSSAASGEGDATVVLEVAPNAGPDRTGTVTVSGETFTVVQAEGCAFSIAPSSAAVSAGVEGGTLSVTASDAACAWSASSGDGWLSIDSGASGSGDGVVSFATAPNAGPERSGTLTVAGETFTVTQADGCAFSIAPGSATAAHGGASGTVTVTASDGACAWTASSADAWLTVDAGSSGTGSGSVSWTAAANGGAARSGSIAIAGDTFTVDQGTPPASPPADPGGSGGGCSTAPFGPEALLLGLLGLLRTRRKA